MVNGNAATRRELRLIRVLDGPTRAVQAVTVTKPDRPSVQTTVRLLKFIFPNVDRAEYPVTAAKSVASIAAHSIKNPGHRILRLSKATVTARAPRSNHPTGPTIFVTIPSQILTLIHAEYRINV